MCFSLRAYLTDVRKLSPADTQDYLNRVGAVLSGSRVSVRTLANLPVGAVGLHG